MLLDRFEAFYAPIAILVSAILEIPRDYFAVLLSISKDRVNREGK